MDYLHQTHGRLRLKSVAFKPGPRMNALCSALAGAEGIRSVRFNKRSNSLIVAFDAATVTGNAVLRTVTCLRESTGLTERAIRPDAGSSRFRSGPLGTSGDIGLMVARLLLGSLARTPVQRGLVSLLAVALR